MSPLAFPTISGPLGQEISNPNDWEAEDLHRFPFPFCETSTEVELGDKVLKSAPDGEVQTN